MRLRRSPWLPRVSSELEPMLLLQRALRVNRGPSPSATSTRSSACSTAGPRARELRVVKRALRAF